MKRATRRILMLTHQCAGRGGSFMRAVSLARPLTRMGYDMTVVAARSNVGLRRRSSDWHGVRILEMPDVLPWRVRNGGLSPLDLAARLLHSRRGFDLLHGLDHRPCVSLPALWRRDHHIPFVSDWADLWGSGGLGIYRAGLPGGILARLDAWLEPYLRQHASAVTAISLHLSERAIALGVPEQRVRLVPAGANADLILPMDKRYARRRQGIAEDGELLICSGFSSLDTRLMLDAFVQLVQLRPGIRLLMTGGKMPEFESSVRLAGLQDHVLHAGMLPYEKLGELLACADIMWLPYGNAPVDVARFPNRFGEYIAAGRPIATNAGGDHAVIVEQEGIGVVAAPEPQATATSIAALLDDPVQRQQMGRRARELAEGPYSWASIACRVAELYEELLQ